MPGELLQRIERQRREEMDSAIPRGSAWSRGRQRLMTHPTSWKPTTNTSVPNEQLDTLFRKVRTFFMQEVNTADRLLDLQTLRHLARFDIPEPNRLVIGATDQTFAFQE